MRCRARRARTAWLTHRGRLAQMSEVTLLTYGGADDFGEFIVFYQDGRRHQEYFTSAAFPTQAQFQALWSQGFTIDSIAYGKGVWAVLYSKPLAGDRHEKGRAQPEQEVQAFRGNNALKELHAHLKSSWSSERRAHQLVYGDGVWAAITYAATDGEGAQEFVKSGKFPESEIAERWERGLFIRSTVYDGERFVLLFEKGDVPQSLYMDKNFPEEEIEDLWSDLYACTNLVYANGKWVLISNEQTRNNHQGWVSDTIFPTDDLDELMCAGGLQPKLPPATQVQGVAKSGWLEKQGGGFKSWKRRWFVLSSKKRTCYYYERQTDLKPKGYFFLNGCEVSVCKDAAIERKHPNTFEVAHPVRRTFYVQAPSAAVRDEWISEIQALLNEDREGRDTEMTRFQTDMLGSSGRASWAEFASKLRSVCEDLTEDDEDALHFVLHLLKDKEPTAEVTSEQISAFIAAFGFVEDAYDKLLQLAASFAGRQAASSVEKLLNGKEHGTYATWVDERHGRCMVSYVEKKKVVHKTVCWDYSADQFFVEEDVASHNLPTVFRSVDSCLKNNGQWNAWTTPLKSELDTFKTTFAKERAESKLEKGSSTKKTLKKSKSSKKKAKEPKSPRKQK